MKKIVFILILLFAFFLTPKVQATSYDDISKEFNVNELINQLPDNSRQVLSDIGITAVDYNQLNEVDYEDIINEIIKITTNQSSEPIKIMLSVIGVMLLYSIIYSIKTSAKTTSMEQVLSVCVTLCITCIIVIPICDVINSGIEIIKTASNFMVIYIPIMLVIMTAHGKAISGASYYSIMIFAGQGVTQISSNIIAPFLKIFLGLSITAGISPDINLKGFIEFIGKIIKWILGFIMTVFTALLTFKQLITTAMDNVSTRAVRYTLTSLVPVVGSALSDAYKTVQSSVGLLKSGVGVFVIIAVAVVFIPAIIQCLFWLLSLGVSKSVAEILDLKEPVTILTTVNTVITTILAIMLCIMSIFIISTALILLLGGGGS